MGRREEEPEWFSSGPISKNDTIELRGFEKIGSRSRNDSEREIVKEEEKRHEDVFEEEESHEEEKENDKDGKDRRILYERELRKVNQSLRGQICLFLPFMTEHEAV